MFFMIPSNKQEGSLRKELRPLKGVLEMREPKQCDGLPEGLKIENGAKRGAHRGKKK